MQIADRLMADQKSAMKNGDRLRVETIRGLRSQLKNKQIEVGRALTEEEVLAVLNSAAKKRRESIEQFRAVGREDRSETEAMELEIIREYLPEPLSEEKIAAIVDETVASLKAGSLKDMGKVMGAVMPQLKGRADGKIVQQLVRSKLSS